MSHTHTVTSPSSSSMSSSIIAIEPRKDLSGDREEEQITPSRTRQGNNYAGDSQQEDGRQDGSGVAAAAAAAAAATVTKRSLRERLIETTRHFADLGFISFGGPGVHVVLLRKRFVDQLKWVDETTFADLFALGNALPGPGSTQLAFSIAIVRNGSLAGLLAFLFWSLPGAAGMAGLAAGVRNFPETLPPIVLALLTGLNAAAVGLIALAAYQLSRTAITDRLTRLLVLGSASFGICYHAPWMYPALIFAGGLATLTWDFRHKLASFARRHVRTRRTSAQQQQRARQSARLDSSPSEIDTAQNIELQERGGSGSGAGAASRLASLRRRGGAGLQSEAAGGSPDAVASANLGATIEATSPSQSERQDMELVTLKKKFAIPLAILFVVMVVVLVVVRAEIPHPPRWLDFFVNMVIAGVIIFGGGPVVIPLLRGYTVTPGWVESRDFLLGFAILQAFPGPNFNFAAYLGVLALPTNPALGAILGWFGIFSPGILLKLSLLPLYSSWRKNQFAKSVLRGLNATAAGLVYTAVWQLFLVGYIYTAASGETMRQTSASGPLTSDPFWGVVAASAFTATQWFACPPPVSILGGALAGLAWYGVVGTAGTQRHPVV